MLNRRNFVKAGSLTALGLGLNLYSPSIFKRKLLAGGSIPGPKKMIFVFQRGGNDAVNTVIPRGDSEYNTTNRPNLFIPEASALDLGNGFAQLHPSMAPLMEIYNSLSLTGVAGPGNLAVLQRIGYAGQSQSHFDSQQYWENGTPGNPEFEEGMLYRQIAETMDPGSNPFVAAALNNSQLTSLKGPIPIPAFNNPGNFSLNVDSARLQKFLGGLPSAPLGADGSGILGVYGGPQDLSGRPYRDLQFATGLSLVESIDIVQSALAQGVYAPENGAVYPDGGFGDRLTDIAMLMKRTPVRVLGINLGGWDTHNNQGTLNGDHPNRLGSLAQGIQALSRDLQDQWDDVLIVTMTEFGRTSKENGSNGTDHGHATAMFVAGGSVNGGVYNCDSATWADGDLLSQNNRYVARKTDYRSVFGDIFQTHFGDDLATVNTVIPGYSTAAADFPADFQSLGFLS